jgi:hypothetical protein
MFIKRCILFLRVVSCTSSFFAMGSLEMIETLLSITEDACYESSAASASNRAFLRVANGLLLIEPL